MRVRVNGAFVLRTLACFVRPPVAFAYGLFQKPRQVIPCVREAGSGETQTSWGRGGFSRVAPPRRPAWHRSGRQPLRQNRTSLGKENSFPQKKSHWNVMPLISANRGRGGALGSRRHDEGEKNSEIQFAWVFKRLSALESAELFLRDNSKEDTSPTVPLTVKRSNVPASESRRRKIPPPVLA